MRIMKKVTSVVLMSCLLCGTFIVGFPSQKVFALSGDGGQTQKITTEKGAGMYLKKINSDQSLTLSEKSSMAKANIKPEVLAQYTQKSIEKANAEAEQKANAKIQEMNNSGNESWSFQITVDNKDGNKVVLQVSDQPEKDTSFTGYLSRLFFAPVYAGTVSKDFGNRYFSVRIVPTTGYTMAGILRQENHYTISKTGLSERYITASKSNVGLTQTTIINSGSISKKYCGKSKGAYVSGYSKYQLKVLNNHVTYTAKDQITSKVSVVAFHKSSARVNESYSWNRYSLTAHPGGM